MREARAAARLDHPGVITIHDVVEHAGSPWIVMQFVSGASLRARINTACRLSWQEVADIGGQVAEALVAAHAAGIVHRDLKPDNILLSDRRAIVSDFGIARIVDATTQLTGTGVLIGTPTYMAPEQLDGGTTGPAVDIWALGATLYAAVEGTPPFNGPTMAALIAAILTKAPARPQHAGPLLDVLGVLLSKNPAQRPDAGAAARMLAAIRQGQTADSQAAGLRQSATATGAAPGLPYPATVAAASAGQFRDTVTGRWGPPDGSRERTDAVFAPTNSPTATGHPSFPDGRPAYLTPSATPLQPQRPSRTRAAGAPYRRLTVRPVLVVLAIAVAVAVTGVFLGLPGRSPSSGALAGGTTAGQSAGASSPTMKQAAAHGHTSTPTAPATASLIATLTDPANSNGQPSVQPVAFSPAGTLAAGDVNGSTYLWNTSTKRVVATLTNPDAGGAVGMAFESNGTMATADDSNTFLFNTSTGSFVRTLDDPIGGLPDAVAFGPDGTLGVGDGSSVYLWNTTNWSLVGTLTYPNVRQASSVAFGPDGTLAVGDDMRADSDGHVYLWDTTTQSLIAALPDPGGSGVQALAFSSDGIVAAADDNGNTYLWNPNTKSLIATVASEGGRPLSVAFGPDGMLAIGQANGSTLLWSSATRSVVATLTDPRGQITDSVAFGPDNTLAVGDSNGSTYLWRVPSGTS